MQTVTTATAAAGAGQAQQAPRPAVMEPPKITTVPAESAAEAAIRFFTPRQYGALGKLCELLQPAAGERPGAKEAGVAEFLDFLIGVSPAARQQLYRGGLDHIEGEARRLFGKAFADVEEEQAEKILRPLLAQWTYEGPVNSRQRFLTELRADVRTATQNSKEMTQVPSASRRRRGGFGAAPYWRPIDPIR